MRPLFPQKADIDLVNRNVRLVPQADVARSAAAIPVALGRQGKCISIVHLMALDRHLVSGPSRRRVPGCCQQSVVGPKRRHFHLFNTKIPGDLVVR